MVPSVYLSTGSTVTYRQCMNGRACALPDIFISSALLKKKKKRLVAAAGPNLTPSSDRWRVVKAIGALILGPIYIQQIYYGSHRSLQTVLMEE